MTTLTDEIVRYNLVARVLHWLIALFLIANLIIGLVHDDVPKTWNVMSLHKSLGLTVLILTVIRIGWRFTFKMPP